TPKDKDYFGFEVNAGGYYLDYACTFYRKFNYKWTAKGFKTKTIINKKGQHIFPKGIYIKVSPFASLSDIRTFITSQHFVIRDAQSHFKNQIPYKYSLHSRNDIGRRDYMIYLMSYLSPEHLIDSWNLNSVYAYKDELISRAMLKEGFKVSTNNIKKIIHEMKKRLNT
ncbi:MAG: hypothetical protein Q7R89_01695, partial [bacterium]|nr:hypothetical protein [bacterium]